MKKFLAAVGTAAVLLTGATACGTQGYNDGGYDQVWDGGHYVYVPHSYYTSHRSLYNNSAHPVHHRSSSYVTSHHVTVEHKTTTTVHSNGKRTTVKRSTTKHTTTRKSSGSSGSRSTRRR